MQMKVETKHLLMLTDFYLFVKIYKKILVKI